MSTAILRVTVAEAFGRKVVLWGLIASGAFVALFSLAFFLLHREITDNSVANDVQSVIAGAVLTVLGLYVTSFLASFLALTLASSSVSAEIDSGVTQAIAIRPITRTSWYLQRWAALVLITGVYVVALGALLLLVAWLISGYRPASTAGLLGLMVVQAVFLVSVGMLASTRLSTMASAVLLFFYFGFSWLGGFVGFIGEIAEREALVTTATLVSLLAPSDGIWKAASSFASPRGINLAAFGDITSMPFASFIQPSPAYLAWVVCFTIILLVLGVRSYQRRDL